MQGNDGTMLRRIFPLRDAEREGAPQPRILDRMNQRSSKSRQPLKLIDRKRVFSTETPINLPFPTLGGKQIWADIFIRDGWRIQHNVLSGHCRLLDRNNIRRAWGNPAHCRERFGVLYRQKNTAVENAHLVMLVHGLGRSAGAFTVLEDCLRRDGYAIANVNYPSTRLSIEEHADNLEQIIESLESVGTISFVTHSLGGLVVRNLLARESSWRDRIAVHRLVMIAPPNKGSQIADRLKELPAYRWLTGASGQGLTTEAAASLPIPEIEFGIIAGGRGTTNGFNPLLTGDNDGLVTVAETALDGAQDFMLVRTTHGLVDDHPQTIDATIAFLRNGHFNPKEPPATD